ncbi:pancreatic secretory granule membrane major glycoprotein GP2-like [Nematostella vectensis]|uniref:pancreatic secretory granule membrane major glycoprotein GP2-like n=1 Tax=Nematostella vectensis TaxID=45351 RepID=UPI0020776CE5|nr:pancreatic secretory granule membrane major glycoprotein GP2-like [Nematostella vectensis]XP_048577991.1 pancreatic secretory granule membrane major glycoprotein GP2-like [Nematostella vectensis]
MFGQLLITCIRGLVALLSIQYHMASGCTNCMTSIPRTSLIGHEFMTLPNTDIHQCYQRCKREILCQSLNYLLSSNTCYLNTKIIGEKPEDEVKNMDATYFENPKRAPAPSECIDYTVLSEPDRNINYVNTDDKCDNSLGTKWYRFTGDGGTMLPTYEVPRLRCNSRASGYMNGTHPSLEEGIVSRKVCFREFNDPCRSINIRVRNCGPFYVYELVSSVTCFARYCTV